MPPPRELSQLQRGARARRGFMEELIFDAKSLVCGDDERAGA